MSTMLHKIIQKIMNLNISTMHLYCKDYNLGVTLSGYDGMSV
jgi:hypothetical protein